MLTESLEWMLGSKSYRSSADSCCGVTVEWKEFCIGEYCGEGFVCFPWNAASTPLAVLGYIYFRGHFTDQGNDFRITVSPAVQES